MPVLWCFWNTQNRWFSGSGFFKEPDPLAILKPNNRTTLEYTQVIFACEPWEYMFGLIYGRAHTRAIHVSLFPEELAQAMLFVGELACCCHLVWWSFSFWTLKTIYFIHLVSICKLRVTGVGEVSHMNFALTQ